MVYRILARFYPKHLRKTYIDLLRYSNIKVNPDRFIGFMLFFGFGLAISLGFYPASLFNLPLILVMFGLFIIFEVIIYMWLVLKADAKSRFIEDVLPDGLQLMSSNLRAGMTVDRALLLSARDEFGPLQEEISFVGKEISTGMEIDKALLSMTKRVRSDKLDKTINLIASGIKSGGKLADLLDQTAKNLRSQQIVEEKVRSNVLMYVIFIFVAVGVGAPMLFGLSTYLVQILTTTLASVQIPTEVSATSTLPLVFQGATITPEFVTIMAVISLIMSSILGSLVIGLIAKGKERYGFKYLPYLLILSIVLFLLVRKLVAQVLTGLFGV